jgi:hypothetical protein
MRRLCLALALLACTACGSSPAAPTPPPLAQVAGSWSGTFDYTVPAGKQAPIAILFDLTQAGSSVNGTYATSAFSGTVTGTVTTSAFSGTLTFNAITVSNTACTGTMAVSGTAGAATMTWTSPLVTANCTNTPTAMTFTIQRR